MRLALKFALVLAMGIFIVLGANATYRVNREIALFETDSRRDGQLLGRALAGAVERIWSQVGEGQALDLVEDTNFRQASINVRWVWFDVPEGDPSHPVIPLQLIPPLQEGVEVAVRQTDEAEGTEALYTYVPVSTPEGRPGAVEIGESQLSDRLYIQRSVLQAVITTVALVAVCGLLAAGLGVLFVGKPIHLLVEKARRVGQGDFSGKLVLSQRDEIGELGKEINAMCEQLLQANERAAREAAARVTAVEQLRHADRLKAIGEIAAGIAHELGTPLNVVSGRAQLIAGENTPGGETHKNAVIIAEQTRRMTVTIRHLLDFARRRRAQKSSCKLGRIIRQTLSMLGPEAEKQKVSVAVDGDLEAQANVDAGQIQQALTNLFLNAVHSMPRGGNLVIRLSHEPPAPWAGCDGGAQDWLRVSVKDEGEGMTRDVLQRIFEPFYTTKKAGEGTGLGLSVTRDIVSDHGGRIEVESEVGKGSCFSIYLPADGGA